MTLPIDTKALENFIHENNLFHTTQNRLILCLKNWWRDNKVDFLENMNADLQTVLTAYKFEKEGYSISKNYSYNPPIDYISVWIRIYDEENSYICEYTAFYDMNLKIFNDKIR